MFMKSQGREVNVHENHDQTDWATKLLIGQRSMDARTTVVNESRQLAVDLENTRGPWGARTPYLHARIEDSKSNKREEDRDTTGQIEATQNRRIP